MEETGREVYRTAIALNNMGVELLQRGSFNPASRLMMDAVQSFQLSTQWSSLPQNSSSSSRVAAKLQRAYTFLAEPPPKEKCGLPIKILSNNCYEAAYKGDSFHEKRPLNVKFAIRIEDCCLRQYSGSDGEASNNLNGAIILHNLAVAHHAISSMTSCNIAARSLRVKAAEIAVYAYKILTTFLGEDGHGEIEEIVSTNTIGVTAIVLRTVADFCFDCGDSVRASKALDNLVKVSRVIDQIETPLCSRINAAPAA